MQRVFLLILFSALLVFLIGCNPTQTDTRALTSNNVSKIIDSHVIYTYHSPDGNRLVQGRGTFPDMLFSDISLGGNPLWVVGKTLDDASLWVVVLDNGKVEGYLIKNGQIERTTVKPDRMAVGTPPLLNVKNNTFQLITPPTDDASLLTHPIVLPTSGELVFVDNLGDLVFWDNSEIGRLQLNAIPDARILLDDNERLLLLSDATTRYAHGILGDNIEAASVTLVATKHTPEVLLTISVPVNNVIEGIAPIWADLTGDGKREIVVTISNANVGAQIVIYNENGRQIAAGPAIGQGNRWRHQIAVAPFGPNGEVELADVLTPHIGGIVEFYRLVDNELKVVAEVKGYTSHVIRSRNLDMAVSGDFDGDGNVELLLPNQGRTELGGIRRTADGAAVMWTVPVGGRLVTNVAVAEFSNNVLAVAVGRDDGVLRVWRP